MTNIKIDKVGLDLLTTFEGVRLKPYLDSVNVPTIGVGSTQYCNGTKVTMKDAPITLEKAHEMLNCYLEKIAIPCIQKTIKVQLNQSQVNSLICLVYNIGCAGFEKSSVARFINTMQPKETIIDAWSLWNKGGGKILPGLVARRAKESANYFK